ncbi:MULTISPECIES: TlpA family protein disulfide reductase [unclassified Streptomyces]|uniref:TlpA family protein disulfide reductase n=1 Tax=unclassified Streptomyces TaxID=2593676 RepID=UPI0038004B7F
MSLSHTSLIKLCAVTLAVAGTAALTACDKTVDNGQVNFVTDSDGIATVPKSDRRSPTALKGKSLAGKQLDVADLRGKVVVINAWGSWCGPCRAEAPLFSSLAAKTKSKGVEFIGINTRDNNLQSALEFEKDFKIKYPSLYDPTGKLLMSAFPKGSLNLQAIPSTVILDRHGDIAARALRPLSEDNLTKMLNPLITEK